MKVTVPKSQLPFEYKYVINDASGNVACKEKDAHKISLEGTQPDTKFLVRDEVSHCGTQQYRSYSVWDLREPALELIWLALYRDQRARAHELT